jgi:glutamate-1-semialdehyde aminotransferase
MKFDKSIRLYEEALGLIPMGTSTFSRCPSLFCIGSAPLYIQSAKGCRVRDVDGNEFIDYAMGLAIITLGYANAEVIEAARKGMEDGMIFTLSCPEESQLARKLTEIIPCAEMVRFFKNGSDSCEGAVKLSRALTGKQRIITVGGYHGFHDWFVASTARNRGIPPVLAELVLPHNYNDLTAIRKTIETRSSEIAALILEPIVNVEPVPNFLEELRALTQANNIVLIFDEMKTGFRLDVGGAQKYFGVTPDLAVFGKGLSNGFPLSALVGSRRLMRQFEDENCFMSGSYATEKASFLAALKTIEILQRGEAIPHIWRTGKALKAGLEKIVAKHDLSKAIRVVGLAPMQHLIFSPAGDVTGAEMKAFLQQECAKLGVLFVGYHHTSFAHSEDDIKATLDVYEQTFAQLAAALRDGSIKSKLVAKPVLNAGVRKE